MENERKATEKRSESEKIKIEIDIQQKTINERALTVQYELAQAGPMLEQAEKAVTGIGRKDLVEIANLLNPPALVKLALEVRMFSSVTCSLFGCTADAVGLLS